MCISVDFFIFCHRYFGGDLLVGDESPFEHNNNIRQMLCRLAPLTFVCFISKGAGEWGEGSVVLRGQICVPGIAGPCPSAECLSIISQ